MTFSEDSVIKDVFAGNLSRVSAILCTAFTVIMGNIYQ